MHSGEWSDTAVRVKVVACCKATVVIGKPFLPDPKEKDYGVIADDILHRIYALKEQV